MSSVCHQCSHQNTAGARFCGGCGTPFMDAAVSYPGNAASPGPARSVIPGGKGNFEKTNVETGGPIVGGAAATVQENSMIGAMDGGGGWNPKTQMEDDVVQPISGWLVVLRSRHMPPYLEVPLFEGRNILGRDPNRGKQHLTDPNASSEHVLILARDGVVRLTDLGSSNGTIVNNRNVDAVDLKHGDMIRIGKTTFTFVPMPQAA